MPGFSTFVFDAYGTLFDVHSAVARHRDALGPRATELSDIWRTKQLEYTWTRTLMRAYLDFRELTAMALDFAAARCDIALTPTTRAALLDAYETLDAYADVRSTLTALKDADAQTAILSNGSPDMLANAITSAGLRHLLDITLSVHELRSFKTIPAAYMLIERDLGVKPEAVSFQSSNRWDIAGAVKAGYRGVWVNRAGQPDEYADLAPARTISSLDKLLDDLG